MLAYLFSLFAISDPGPVVETCAFLPQAEARICNVRHRGRRS